MISEVTGAPVAECWIEGRPQKPGFYLTRFEWCGNPWYFLFNCILDPDCPDNPDKLIYINHHAGNRVYELRLGDITHYCKPTAENFQKILNTLHEVTFDKENMRYIKKLEKNNG